MSILQPTVVTIIQTRQCTASCPNCSFQCSPTNHVWVSLSEAESFVRSCVSLYPSVKVLVMTGGECTLRWEDLLYLIRLGKSLGLVTRIVTNGHWAVNDEQTKDKVGLLRSSGLDEINVSTGDEHLRYVSLDKVVRAVVASAEIGMTCVVNIESHKDSQFREVDFLNVPEIRSLVGKVSPQKIIISKSLWVELRTKNGLSYEGLTVNGGQNGCDSILTTLALNPFGYQLACCGITVEYIDALVLGKASTTEQVRDNMLAQHNDLMKIWVYAQGATFVLDTLNKAMGNPRQEGCRHPCVDCLLLFANPKFAEYLNAHKEEYVGEIMLRYEYKRRLYDPDKISV